MPLKCNCVFCQRNMYDVSPGKYPPICNECWGSFPDHNRWTIGLGLKIATLLKTDGVVSIENFT